MKKRFLILICIVVFAIHIQGQTESKYFRYVKTETVTSIYSKKEINHALEKGCIQLSFRLSPLEREMVFYKAHVIPFQEMINEGIFTKERMKNLEEGKERIKINVTFDETGMVSYVSFYHRNDEPLLLTEEELLQIQKKYKTVKYDLSHAVVHEAEGCNGTKDSFYIIDSFPIRFDDLKY